MGLISRVSSRTYRNRTRLITKILKMSGVTVTQHDQTKINKFARRHQAQLETKSEIQKITDAMQDLDVLFLEEDEGTKVPYQMGDLFVMLDQEEIEEYIEQNMRNCNKRLLELEKTKADNNSVLIKLKKDLYAKFGTEINLDDDEA